MMCLIKQSVRHGVIICLERGQLYVLLMVHRTLSPQRQIFRYSSDITQRRDEY